jgi:hypothetical protein
MNYDLVAIPGSDVPQAVNPVFQHVPAACRDGPCRIRASMRQSLMSWAEDRATQRCESQRRPRGQGRSRGRDRPGRVPFLPASGLAPKR